MAPAVPTLNMNWVTPVGAAEHLARQRGEKVLIHCQYGLGRSVLLILCGSWPEDTRRWTRSSSPGASAARCPN